jgi:oligopeptide transport system substrate-binding protein
MPSILKFAAFTFLLFLAACGHKTNSLDANKTVFRYNESFGITSLDPAFTRSQENIWAVNQLFNGLVQLDDQLNVKPCIAKSWKISEDGLLYTFYLRNDVYFHDHVLFLNNKGRKVRASDFVNSFSRILDKDIASPGAWVFNSVDRSAKSNYKGFVDINDTTLQIHLSKPFPPFLGLLSMQYCSVIPIEVAEYFGADFRNNPVGTGPFYFKYWKEGEKLVLLKNQNYFEKENGAALPHLDAVAISFIKDRQSAFLEFIKGNFDFMSGLDGSYKDDVLNKDGTLNGKYYGKFKMTTKPYLMSHYIGFLVDENLDAVRESPVKNKFFRQAVNYAIDKKKMITYIRNNIGKAANSGFVPIGLPSFDSVKVRGYTHNPDKAKSLLQQAGFSDKNPCPPIKLYTSALYSDMCEFIQNELRAVGIPASVEVTASATLNEMVAQSDATFYRKSWLADYADAENYLALFYSKNFSPAGPNYSHYKNNVYDRLYEQALAENNIEKRNTLYQEMDKLLIEDAPIVPLYYDASVVFTQNTISDLPVNPLNLLVLKTVKKVKN